MVTTRARVQLVDVSASTIVLLQHVLTSFVKYMIFSKNRQQPPTTGPSVDATTIFPDAGLNLEHRIGGVGWLTSSLELTSKAAGLTVNGGNVVKPAACANLRPSVSASNSVCARSPFHVVVLVCT